MVHGCRTGRIAALAREHASTIYKTRGFATPRRPVQKGLEEAKMPDVNWRIRAREFTNCNCAYGCPCQFNALPTYGDCKAVVALAISEGHHGNTRLDGLNTVAVLAWPGPIHKGSGEALIIVDERASP